MKSLLVNFSKNLLDSILTIGRRIRIRGIKSNHKTINILQAEPYLHSGMGQVSFCQEALKKFLILDPGVFSFL